MAMAAKIPVIGSNVGGIPEIVMDGKTGQLVPPNDAERLAKAIIRAIKNEDSISTMIDNAYQNVLTNYTMQAMGQDLDNVYKQILK